MPLDTRDMPPQIPGVRGLAPEGSCNHHEQTKGIQKCFLNQQLTILKTVAQTRRAYRVEHNRRTERRLSSVVSVTRLEIVGGFTACVTLYGLLTHTQLRKLALENRVGVSLV